MSLAPSPRQPAPLPRECRDRDGAGVSPGAAALVRVALTRPSLVALVGIRPLYDALTLLSGESEEYAGPGSDTNWTG